VIHQPNYMANYPNSNYACMYNSLYRPGAEHGIKYEYLQWRIPVSQPTSDSSVEFAVDVGIFAIIWISITATSTTASRSSVFTTFSTICSKASSGFTLSTIIYATSRSIRTSIG
jgi:hypothetical protein